ncbi:MAG: helix-turn-helix domain-containing protein [Candidatus Acidiferrales bacterium]
MHHSNAHYGQVPVFSAKIPKNPETQIEGTSAREGLLTIREASQYLSVSVSTLYGWVWQRRIPFVKIGRVLRFDPQDLAAFIEANKHVPRKEISPSSSRVNPCYNTRAAGKG